jgi:hypothetical protein
MKAIRMVLGTMIATVCLLTYAMPVSVFAHSSSDEIENDNLVSPQQAPYFQGASVRAYDILKSSKN